MLIFKIIKYKFYKNFNINLLSKKSINKYNLILIIINKPIKIIYYELI